MEMYTFWRKGVFVEILTILAPRKSAVSPRTSTRWPHADTFRPPFRLSRSKTRKRRMVMDTIRRDRNIWWKFAKTDNTILKYRHLHIYKLYMTLIYIFMWYHFEKWYYFENLINDDVPKYVHFRIRTSALQLIPTTRKTTRQMRLQERAPSPPASRICSTDSNRRWEFQPIFSINSNFSYKRIVFILIRNKQKL